MGEAAGMDGAGIIYANAGPNLIGQARQYISYGPTSQSSVRNGASGRPDELNRLPTPALLN